MNEEKPLPYSHKKRSGSEKRQLGAVFTFRLLPEERKRIEERAEAKGLELGSYIRSVLVKDSKLRCRRKARADVALLSQIFGQLRKAGSNVHEVLKAIRFQNPFTEEELRQAAKELDLAAKAILEALGREA